MRVTVSVTSPDRSAGACVAAGAFVVVVTASSDLGPGTVAVHCPARPLCPGLRWRARWGLAVGGEQGVRHVFKLLREELTLALAQVGCPSPAAVTRAHVAGRL